MADRLRGYQKLIAETARTEDPATLALLEELMRTWSPTLDGLTRPRFDALVAEATAAAAELAATGELIMFCQATGLAVPANWKEAP
jgi:hypothetical protein